MVNNHKELLNALSDILPTHYEMTLHSGLKTPCISYMEINNYVSSNGDTLGYSRLTYQIKVWGNRIDELMEYATQIDKALKPLGYTRISSGELYDVNSSMIQKILTYEALALEEYK